MKKLISLLTATFILLPSIMWAGTSPWMFRLRAINVNPDVSSNTISIIGGKVKNITDRYAPEFDITYFINNNISAELILATTKHYVDAKGTALDVNGKTKLGSVYILPPTLTFQYRPMPNNQINPYIGLGMNYTHFYNQKEHRSLTDIEYKNSFRPAAQVGIDIKLYKDYFLNFDLKKVLVRSDVNVTSGATVVETVVDLNPYIFGVGIGYRV